MEKLDPNLTDFLGNLIFEDFLENVSEKLSFIQNLPIMTGILHENLRMYVSKQVRRYSPYRRE
jgi:hypothetical protein